MNIYNKHLIHNYNSVNNAYEDTALKLQCKSESKFS